MLFKSIISRYVTPRVPSVFNNPSDWDFGSHSSRLKGSSNPSQVYTVICIIVHSTSCAITYRFLRYHTSEGSWKQIGRKKFGVSAKPICNPAFLNIKHNTGYGNVAIENMRLYWNEINWTLCTIWMVIVMQEHNMTCESRSQILCLTPGRLRRLHADIATTIWIHRRETNGRSY